MTDSPFFFPAEAFVRPSRAAAFCPRGRGAGRPGQVHNSCEGSVEVGRDGEEEGEERGPAFSLRFPLTRHLTSDLTLDKFHGLFTFVLLGQLLVGGRENWNNP